MTRERLYEKANERYESYNKRLGQDTDFTNETVSYRAIQENKDKALEAFSEGNEILAYLLNTCFEKGIVTKGCCSGHDGKKPYISFEYMEENMPYIKALLSNLDLENIEIRMEKKNVQEHEIGFYSYNNVDDFFESINSILKQTSESTKSNLPKVFSQMFEIFDTDTLGDYSTLALYYQKRKDDDCITIVSPVKEYIEVSTNKAHLIDDKNSSILFSKDKRTNINKTLEQIISNIKRVNKARIQKGYAFVQPTIPTKTLTEVSIDEVLDTIQEFKECQNEEETTRIEVSPDSKDFRKRNISVINTKYGIDQNQRTIFNFENGYDFDNMLLPEFICRLLENEKITDVVYRETHNGSKGTCAIVDENENTLLLDNMKSDIALKTLFTVEEIKKQTPKTKVKAISRPSL